MTPLLVVTWLPPDGTGIDALQLVRRLLRRASQEQAALPDTICPPAPGKLPNVLPDCGSDRLAGALGHAVLRGTLLSVATSGMPTTDLRLLAERGVIRPHVAFRDPVKAVRGVLGRGARGRPGRGLPGAASAAAAISLVAGAAERLQAWLEVPGVLPIDLDRLAASPSDVLPLVMAHLGIVPEHDEEVSAFLADWSGRKSLVQEADAEAATLTAAEEAEIQGALGPLHARCLAAAEAAMARSAEQQAVVVADG